MGTTPPVAPLSQAVISSSPRLSSSMSSKPHALPALLPSVSFMICGSPVSWRGFCSHARAPDVAMPPPAARSPRGLLELSTVLTLGLLLTFSLAGPLKLPPSSNSIHQDIFFLFACNFCVSPGWSLWRRARQSNASVNTNSAAALMRSHSALSLAEAAGIVRGEITEHCFISALGAQTYSSYSRGKWQSKRSVLNVASPSHHLSREERWCQRRLLHGAASAEKHRMSPQLEQAGLIFRGNAA